MPVRKVKITLTSEPWTEMLPGHLTLMDGSTLFLANHKIWIWDSCNFWNLHTGRLDHLLLESVVGELRKSSLDAIARQRIERFSCKVRRWFSRPRCGCQLTLCDSPLHSFLSGNGKSYLLPHQQRHSGLQVRPPPNLPRQLFPSP